MPLCSTWCYVKQHLYFYFTFRKNFFFLTSRDIVLTAQTASWTYKIHMSFCEHKEGTAQANNFKLTTTTLTLAFEKKHQTLITSEQRALVPS